MPLFFLDTVYRRSILLPSISAQTLDDSSRSKLVLTPTCGGIHPGWIEPASPIELTTSRIEAFQAGRFYASSVETFAQSFFHRGPVLGSNET